MLLSFAIFIAGLILLVLGADILVNGASRIARSFNIPPMVIGLTIVAFGTSLPETAASVSAALTGHTDLALGNIVGSNIYNLCLILGIAALIAPLKVTKQLIRQEIPFMLAATVLLILMIMNGVLSSQEAGFLFLLAILYTVALIVQAKKNPPDKIDEDPDACETGGVLSRAPAPLLVFAGLIMLTIGGSALVSGATTIASLLGVSDLVIGLTVVAIGTSMPEVATCVLAVLRNERDLAVGNVVGSNIFNILICLGLSGMVAPGGLPAPPALLNFDIWVMLAVACVALPIVISDREVSRWEGLILLIYCVCYISYSLFAAAHHDLLPAWSMVVIAFVLPLTILIFFNAFRRTSPKTEP